jgi:hypothetical protein
VCAPPRSPPRAASPRPLPPHAAATPAPNTTMFFPVPRRLCAAALCLISQFFSVVWSLHRHCFTGQIESKVIIFLVFSKPGVDVCVCQAVYGRETKDSVRHSLAPSKSLISFKLPFFGVSMSFDSIISHQICFTTCLGLN